MNEGVKHPISRRDLLRRSAMGFGHVALSALLAEQAGLTRAANAATTSANPFAAKPTHHKPTAKRAIFIFLEGGVSQIDSWDHKPLVNRDAGKPLPPTIAKPKFTFAETGRLLASPFKFDRYGQRGMWASDLFPEQNKIIDEFAFIHSLHHSNEDHNTAKTMIHTGVGREIRPTMGAWLSYGLGSVNENLPAYIDILPGGAKSRPTGFLPSVYQGTPLGRPDKRRVGRQWENLDGQWQGQSRQLQLIQQLNGEHAARVGGVEANDALEAEIRNMEMAFRMQSEAPELLSIKEESVATREQYGIGERNSDDFGRALLIGRRFLEAGVRFIMVKHATRKYGNLWDQHENLEKGHRGNASAVDKPIAGLIRDLKARGMLEDTVVMVGSEFGRTPMLEIKDGGEGRLRNGRDHNPHGYTMWFAGGGFKGGVNHGKTDDYGYHAIEDKVHIHDLHATLLHCMGIDHEKLTYRHAGRDFRLTDVFGEVVEGVLR